MISAHDRLMELYRTGGVDEVRRGVSDYISWRRNVLGSLVRVYWPGVSTTTLAGVECKWKIQRTVDWNRARNANGELPVLEAFLEDVDEESVLWDVGSHFGTYTIPAALKGARVLAFEPYEPYRDRLTEHAWLNLVINRVDVRDHALGGEDKHAGLSIVGDGEHQITHNGDVRVWVRPGDDVIGRRPTHIKIDTEGYEHEVLDGMTETLGIADSVLIEVHGPGDILSLKERLRVAGFGVETCRLRSRSQPFLLGRRSG